MGQLSSRPNNAEFVHEPYVLLKYTTNTADNNKHPHPLDDTPVGAAETDGGRKKAGKEEKKRKKSFWRWPSLHFPRRRAAKYDLAQAEKKYLNEARSYALTSEVVPTEEQLEQDVPDKGDIRSRYKIGHKLGEGRFGFVCQGTRCKDGLEVAVKFSVKSPNAPYIRVPGHPECLPMEIGLTLMASQGPSVPHIVKMLDWQDETGHYITVMERPSPCVDLSRFVELRGGSLDEGTARRVMRQVVDAANVCAKRGVFHRDIKPQNLLVNQDTMEVKLIDFKCAALMKRFAYKSFCGTRANCPPEFNINGRYHAKPTTVWSLGLLLFVIVCGYYPTKHDLHVIGENNWTREGLSQEFCQMICACLQPDPQRRLVLEKMRLHDWFKVME